MRTLTMLGVLTMLATTAAAANSADALLERGVELRAKGQPAAALELFRQANAQAPSARATAQEGLAEMSLHRWLDAHEHLRAALARHDSEWIENPKTRQGLEKMLTDVDGHLSRLRVQGTAGAEVVVDGKTVGHIPMPDPVYVNPGTITLRAIAVGRAGVEKQLVAAAGEEVVATLELDALPLEPAIPAIAPPPVVSFTTPPEAPRWRKWTGAALIGAGAASLAAGIVWIDINNKGTGTCGSTGRCTKSYDTALQGWIAVSAGAVMAATGTGLVLWKGHRQEVGVAIGPGSATLSGTF